MLKHRPREASKIVGFLRITREAVLRSVQKPVSEGNSPVSRRLSLYQIESVLTMGLQ